MCNFSCFLNSRALCPCSDLDQTSADEPGFSRGEALPRFGAQQWLGAGHVFLSFTIPIGSMYSIFTYIWLIYLHELYGILKMTALNVWQWKICRLYDPEMLGWKKWWKVRIDSGEQFLDSNVSLLPTNCQKEMPRQNTKKIRPPPWCFVPCLTLPNTNIAHPKKKLVFQPSMFRCELLVPGRVFSPASFPANVEWPTRTSPSIAAWVPEQLGKSQRCQSWPWYSSDFFVRGKL